MVDAIRLIHLILLASLFSLCLCQLSCTVGSSCSSDTSTSPGSTQHSLKNGNSDTHGSDASVASTVDTANENSTHPSSTTTELATSLPQAGGTQVSAISKATDGSSLGSSTQQPSETGLSVGSNTAGGSHSNSPGIFSGTPHVTSGQSASGTGTENASFISAASGTPSGGIATGTSNIGSGRVTAGQPLESGLLIGSAQSSGTRAINDSSLDEASKTSSSASLAGPFHFLSNQPPTSAKGAKSSSSTQESTIRISETAPAVSTKVTVISGTTKTDIVLFGNSQSAPITLPPASTSILTNGEEATSAALLLASKLEDMISKAKHCEEGDDSSDNDCDTDAVVALIGGAKSYSKGLLSKLKKPPGADSGGCTSSLFSLVSCAIGGLEDLAGVIPGASKKITDLLDDLGNVAKVLETGPPEDDNSNDDNEDEDDDKDSSSSSCSASEVQQCTSSCFLSQGSGTQSATRSCTNICKTVTGCSVSASSTSTVSFLGAAASWEVFVDPKPTQDSLEDRQAASAQMVSLLSSWGYTLNLVKSRKDGKSHTGGIGPGKATKGSHGDTVSCSVTA